MEWDMTPKLLNQPHNITNYATEIYFARLMNHTHLVPTY